MKKIILLFIFSVALISDINFTDVNADAKADSMGFDVDSTKYGSYKVYDTEEHYFWAEGVIVGYGELQSAVYEDQMDDNYVVVIHYLTVEPIDSRIDLVANYNSNVSYAEITSDIDNAFLNLGYGYYAEAVGYDMRQPSPEPEPSSTTYTASVEIGDDTKVSGSVDFDANELRIRTYHSSSQEIFNVRYSYSCNFID